MTVSNTDLEANQLKGTGTSRRRNKEVSMSVVVNTNSSAIAASNHLSRSNSMLQKSLNRLSSGSKITSPGDDAGGLAVSSKMKAAISRHGAFMQNLGNAKSYLDTQDGALETAGKIVERIGELKTLSADVTKSASDRANYNTEFKSLQSQLANLESKSFNGVPLFSDEVMSVGVNDTGATVEIGGFELFGEETASTVLADQITRSHVTSGPLLVTGPSQTIFGGGFNHALNDSSDWDDASSGSGTSSISGGEMVLRSDGHGSTGAAVTKNPFPGHFEFWTEFASDSPTGGLLIKIGDREAFSVVPGDTQKHRLEVSFNIDAGGIALFRVDATSGSDIREGIGYSNHGYPTMDGPITLSTMGDEAYELTIDRFYGTQYTGSYTPTTISPASHSIKRETVTPGLETVTVVENTKTNFGNLSEVTDLDSVDFDTVAGALEEVASFRAQNGAKRSRLNFASSQLAANEANLKEANSRIVDVDVAEESTQLARANILVQAGSAMLEQANASSQVALKLVA